MACLLLLNGLRVSEVCGVDIDDLAEERWHHTVTLHGEGTEDAIIPLAPRTRAAVDQAVDERDTGPLLRNRWGNRLTRNHAATAVATLASRACVQDFARQADPKTTRRSTATATARPSRHLRHRPVRRRLRVEDPGAMLMAQRCRREVTLLRWLRYYPNR
jgi:integrase/recombinase XerD